MRPNRATLTVSLVCKVPYQDNGFDCGLFVCRYAYAMYKLAGKIFSYGELATMGPLQNVIRSITRSDEFGFGMEDMARMRREMQTLIRRLRALQGRT